MSPRLLPSPSRRAARALSVFAATAGLALAAAPADAATLSFTGTDPKGDAAGQTGLDILSATAAYDKTAGSFTVTVETVTPLAAANGAFGIFFGTATDGKCLYDPNQGDSVALKPAVQFALASFQGNTIPPVYSYTGRSEEDFPPQQADVKSTGNKLTLSTKADATLANLPLDCVYMFGAYDKDGTGTVADSLTGPLADPSAGGATPPPADPSTPPKTGGTPGDEPQRTPIVVVTADPDADRDGIPDSRDACKTAPGAAKNGCPTLKPADEVRLGAKRVVVDRLVALTGKDCPARVRIKVLSKGKAIGSTVVTVDRHGSFCRVNGIVRLKKRVKKVRVTAKAAGMGSLARSARR